MVMLRFRTCAQAEHHLQANGFSFMGAPDRWRKCADGIAVYAGIQRISGTRRAGPALVLISSEKVSRSNDRV
jgi:hypothetical protein